MTNTNPKVYDHYEISPCRRLDDAGLPDPNGHVVEVCKPEEADMWTLYGHIAGEGVEAIGDFNSRDAAEEVFFRITGLRFTGSYKADAHLRVMHAGPKLLAALTAASEWIDAQTFVQRTEIQRAIRHAIAEATGGTAYASSDAVPATSHELDIHAILRDRRQIAVVWGIEDVKEVRPDLNDDQAWEVLQTADRHHDAELGMSWTTLECVSEMLFGSDPETDEE